MNLIYIHEIYRLVFFQYINYFCNIQTPKFNLSIFALKYNKDLALNPPAD